VSDEKLRELERVFQESGSEEAELAWLRELARVGEKLDWESYSRLHELDVEAAAGYLRWRVETGDLRQERLEFAAGCGDRAAAAVVGVDASNLRTSQDILNLSWEPKATVIAALGLARASLKTGSLPPSSQDRVGATVERVEVWLASSIPKSFPYSEDFDRHDWLNNHLARMDRDSTDIESLVIMAAFATPEDIRALEPALVRWAFCND
jgi:hypothetical protein